MHKRAVDNLSIIPASYVDKIFLYFITRILDVKRNMKYSKDNGNQVTNLWHNRNQVIVN